MLGARAARHIRALALSALLVASGPIETAEIRVVALLRLAAALSRARRVGIQFFRSRVVVLREPGAAAQHDGNRDHNECSAARHWPGKLRAGSEVVQSAYGRGYRAKRVGARSRASKRSVAPVRRRS